MISICRYHDISVGHRICGHESHCARLHGHNYRIHFTCTADELDALGRVLDFQVVKERLCQWLEDHWDHRFLVWDKDPLLEGLRALDPSVSVLPCNPSAENMARYLGEVVGPAQTLAVNEFFVTLQGEASFAGTPAVFVRFQGCPVACPWCDTQYAARLDGATLDFAAVRAKQGPGAGYADVEPEALLAATREAGPRHVVLTGGEPCRHDLTELTSRLVAEGFRVQIETSGTMPIRCHADVWVTLSPKLDMPGGLAVRQDAWERAGEIKFPVDTAADLARFEQALAAARKAAARPLTELVWLQPVSQGKEATRLCVEAAFAHQWRVSVQAHKYLDLR